jgi:hypothetical protein
MLCRVSLDLFLGMSDGIPQGIVPCLSRYHTNHIEIKETEESSSENPRRTTSKHGAGFVEHVDGARLA